MALELKQQQKLELRWTQELTQSVRILQMHSQQLLSYLWEVSAENPLIDLQNDRFDEYVRQAAGSGTRQSFPSTAQSDAYQDPFARIAADGQDPGDMMQLVLNDQLERKHPGRLTGLCRQLIASIDDKGYLHPESLGELAVPPTVLERAVQIVQSLEPAGIGARSIQECLCIQLRRDDTSPLALDILQNHYDDFLHQRWPTLARKLGVGRDAVMAARDCIVQLNVYPGETFDVQSTQPYVVPDVLVELNGDRPEVRISDRYLPQVRMCDNYLRLYRATQDPEVRAYLRLKIRQAGWIIRALELRGRTIEAIMRELISRQMDYFLGRSKKLLPMTMLEVARSIGVNVSTVSRAVSDRYLRCCHGVVRMRGLFLRARYETGGDCLSGEDVKGMIEYLIRQEARPLSDREIAVILNQRKVLISRRTVAKYRIQLGLGNAYQRRAQKFA